MSIEKGRIQKKRKPAARDNAAFGTKHSPKTLGEGARKDVTRQVDVLFQKLTSRVGSEEDRSIKWLETHNALIDLGEPAVATLLDTAMSRKSGKGPYGPGFIQVNDIIKRCDQEAKKRIAKIVIDKCMMMPNRRVSFTSRWADLARVLEKLAREVRDKSIFSPVVPLLIKRLKINDDIRHGIVYALASIGDKRAYEPLIEMASSVRYGTLHDAVVALGNFGDPRAVPLLEDIYFGRGKYKKYEYPGEYRVFKSGGDNQSMAEAVFAAIYKLSPSTELPMYRGRWDVLGYASQDAYFNSRTYLGPYNYPGSPDIP